MIKDEIEPVETTSPNILVEQTEQLKLLFPQIFREAMLECNNYALLYVARFTWLRHD